MSLQTRLEALVAAIGADVKALQAGGGGGGASTKMSALPDATSLADLDEFLLLQGGTSKTVSSNIVTQYIESRGRQLGGSVAQQTFAAAEAYIAGSFRLIPTGRLQVQSMYRLRMQIAKTSTAGTATPIINVKIGTAGTTADTTRAALTFQAQTAVADDGFIDVFVTFRTVGSGTTAIISASGVLDHRLAATGLSVSNTGMAKAVSAGFDSTVAGLGIGCSFTGGTSFTGTTDLVQAELMNLA